MSNTIRGAIRGLTVRQPWAFAISRLGKRIENRTWQSHYRGLIAVHAAVGFNGHDKRMVGVAAEIGGVPERLVQEGAATRGAVVAVARLADVCSASLRIADRVARAVEERERELHASIARGHAFAEEMRDYCAPHGLNHLWADRLDARLRGESDV